MRKKIKHAGLITVFTSIVVILYYWGDIPALQIGESAYGFLNSQAYHEICLLLFVPVLIYAAVIFRLKGAITASLVVSAALLPHALSFSPYPDPIFREATFGVISLLLGGFIANQLNNREKLEKEETKLERYITQTLEAQETERRHLAYELHDETAQDLIDISHKIDELVERSRTAAPKITARLERLRGDVDLVLEGTRRFIQGLRPPLLEELGLVPALKWLAEQAADEAAFKVKVEAMGSSNRLPDFLELCLFRIAQEAVTNAKKHSQALYLEIRVEHTDKLAQLKVTDNGIGFSPSIYDQLGKNGKFGLIGITERARLAGGKANIQSAPGKGTCISVELPIFAK